MSKQIKINLDDEQVRILYAESNRQCRQPHEHARFLILKSLGLVGDESPTLAQMNNRQAASTLTETSSKAVAVVNA